MQASQSVHMGPENQRSRDHLETDSQQIGMTVMAPLNQQTEHKEEILQVLKVYNDSGIQVGSRYGQVAHIFRVVSECRW